jgi:hypothetical protein
LAPSPTVTGSVKAQVTSTGAIRSITPNAAGVTVKVPAGGSLSFGSVVAPNNGLVSALATASKGFSGCPSYRLSIEDAAHTRLAATSGCEVEQVFVDAVGPEPAATYTLVLDNLGASAGTTTLSLSRSKTRRRRSRRAGRARS